ncbi:MAG: prolyl oligopeptidase family serine peptidase, partial [Chloroflexi bacterium]|nr:prolyl oligopeptidase family serine peptidase [Chloroflexota bacterium]
GHGESDGALDAETVNDVRAAAAYFRTRPEVDGDRIAVRGSSLGGHFAIHAGARFPDVIKAVVAVCPAPEDVILPYVLDVDPEEIASAPELGYRLNKPDFLRYLREASIFEAVARISPRPILLIHARGDEDIPYRHTERLYAEAGEPKTLLLVDDGHHSSAQHDLDVHRVTCDWLRKALGGR